MNRLKFLLCFLCLQGYGFANCFEGLFCNLDYAYTGSYRNDRLETTIDAFDPPDTLILTDTLKGKNLSVYTIGIKGSFSVCDQWIVKGYGDIGRINRGDYFETTTQSPIPIRSFTHAHIKSGRVYDYSIAVEYLYPLTCQFRLGPAVGYSTHFQKIKIGTAITNGNEDDLLSHLNYKMRWQGPWLGFEGVWKQCEYLVNFGYEYHWSHWRASWNLDGPDIPGRAFSDKRHAHHAHGDVFFLEGSYSFCGGWTVGLGLKYQYWKATHGKERPKAGSFSAVGISDTEVDKVHKAVWQSWQIEINAGYSF